MIVSENNIHDALAYLAEDPHPLALAQKDVTDAENYRDEIYARCFLSASGSVEARKASAQITPAHIEANNAVAAAALELDRHKARTKTAYMLIEVWRTENANKRASEKVW